MERSPVAHAPPSSPSGPPHSSSSSGGGAAFMAAGEAHESASLSPRAASFSGRDSVGVASDELWRNKAESGARLRAFEQARSVQIDVFQERDRAYWQQFEREIARAKDENARLQRFFALRIQADLAYAESLRKIRQALEAPAPAASQGSSGPGSSGGGGGDLSLVSSCAKAIATLGEVQQQLSEKLVQFTNVVKRDVIARPLDEMVATYDERTAVMLVDGKRLDAALAQAQRAVVQSFAAYDALLREMESAGTPLTGTTSAAAPRRDLWLAETAYCIHVQALQQQRVEYVKGMAALFTQYKSLELLRASVIQTALDTYNRKQKLTYNELAGAMAEPMAATAKIDPERDLVQSVRRIPKNYTAAALSSTEHADDKLFASLASPLKSPLLVRCGFLKLQQSGSLLFKSVKDVLCAITQDECLHLMELKESANRSIAQSAAAMLDAIVTSEQTNAVACATVCLTNCRIEILGKSTAPTFEVTELSAPSGLWGTVLGLESSRTFTFQCSSQTDLIDWVVAAKRFISTGSSMVNR